MDTTRDDSAEHRQRYATSVSTLPTPATAAQRSESRAAQRCYYVTFIIAFIGAVLTCITSITLFEITQTEFRSSSHKSTDDCILFVNGQNVSAGVAACYFTLILKVLVLITTIGLIIIYLVLLIKGARILSPVRVCGTVTFLMVAVVSCVIGIVTRIGIDTTCDYNNRGDLCTSYQGFVRASERTAYALAVFYLALFCWNLLTVIAYCIKNNRGRSQAAVDSTAPLLPSGPNVYSTMRAEGRRNPFQDDAHI